MQPGAAFAIAAMRGLFRYHLAWNVRGGRGGQLLRPAHAPESEDGLRPGRRARRRHRGRAHAGRAAVGRAHRSGGRAPGADGLLVRHRPHPASCGCCPPRPALWPLALDALLAGLFWSGHALAAFALPLAVTGRRERPFYVAGFAAVGGLAFAVATALGGALASWLPDRSALPGLEFHNLQVLFVLSGVLRLAAAFLSRAHRRAGRARRGRALVGHRRLDRAPVRPGGGGARPGCGHRTGARPSGSRAAMGAEPARPARRKTRSQAVPTDAAEHRGGPP